MHMQKKIGAMAIMFALLIMVATPTSGYGIAGSFVTADGQEFSYSIFEGDWLLLEAMWTGCSFCKDEHPELVKLYEELGDDMDFVSIAFFDSETPSDLAEWEANYPAQWLLGLDKSLDEQFGVERTPTMLLMNPNGELVKYWVGFTSAAVLQQEIEPFLSGENTFVVSDNRIPAGAADGLDGGSVLGNLFSNPVFLGSITLVALMAIYFKSTGAKS